MKTNLMSLAIVAMAWLGGCSTFPASLEEADAVPNEQILGSISLTGSAPAKITVIRDRSVFGGSIVSFFFSVNGMDVVQLRTGQKYTFLVNPGETFLSVRTNAIGATNKPIQV